MRVLIAADSFKDALPASAVCAAIARGLRQRTDEVQPIEMPLADGGEGTLAVLAKAMSLRLVDAPSQDPLGRPIVAPLGIDAEKTLAVIEAATACGLGLLTAIERNPTKTTTYGVGLLVDAAVKLGVSRILLTIGGTATNDGGVGMATALGWRFLDRDRHPLPLQGKALVHLRHIEPPDRSQALPSVDVLCDVDNPLLGASGATYVFARQKGATDSDLEVLETGLATLSRCAAEQLDSRIDAQTPGAGAAGGLGFGALAFLNAQLVPGTRTLLECVGFDSALDVADLVITGEGRLDEQTLQGKLIHGIAARCRHRRKPLIVLCGQASMREDQWRTLGITAVHCIDSSDAPLKTKLERTAHNLTATAARIPLR